MAMSKAQRRAARTRCGSATPAPWKMVRSFNGHWRERYYEIWTEEGGKDDRPIAHLEGDNAVWLYEGEDLANALFVAHARIDLPAALDHIDALEKKVARLERIKKGRAK